MIRGFLNIVFTCVASFMCAAAAPRPNINHLIAADVGWDDFACYGARADLGASAMKPKGLTSAHRAKPRTDGDRRKTRNLRRDF